MNIICFIFFKNYAITSDVCQYSTVQAYLTSFLKFYIFISEVHEVFTIDSIQIEGSKKSIVTDVSYPKISYSVSSDRQGEAVESAQLYVGGRLFAVNDPLSFRLRMPLEPLTKYGVELTVRAKSGETASRKTEFMTGKLDTAWTAKWLSHPTYRVPKKGSPKPVAFRHTFSCTKKIKSAYLLSTALGIYTVRLNGKSVQTGMFAPGLTSYEHQLQYTVCDVSDLLAGDNELLFTVAGGWACGLFTYHQVNAITCDRQYLLCELHIAYEDGSRQVIGSDENWMTTEDTPVRAADWYNGEVYDATFDRASAVWVPVRTKRPPVNPQLLARYGEAITGHEILQPVSVQKAASGEYIYDFGQNFAGTVVAKINAKHGQKIRFRHAEVLVDGELFTKALRSAKAEAVYICREGEQAYAPQYTFMGFRYVGVSGIEPQELSLCAVAVHSDTEETGSFSCSNALLNRLHENIRWSAKSNFVDIPTDCPQRDERMGWTGDIALFASTACRIFDMQRFLDKWLLDLKAEQGRGGGFPMVIPRQGSKMPILATSCWGDCCVLVPWALYQDTGNKDILMRQYGSMVRFLKAVKFWASLSVTPKGGGNIWKYPFHYGDWCAPGETNVQWLKKAPWIATAFYANSCFIVSQIAEILGNNADAEKYREKAREICISYRNVFTDGKGKLKKEFQTAYVLPLAFGMTDGTQTAAMAENLVRLIEENGNCLQTGFPGTPYILFALADNGHADKAYELLLQEKCPSWLYEVKAGGTTIWERWDALRPDGTVNTGKDDTEDGGMVSFNHYAYGAVGDFLYRRIAGLEPTSGGFRTFRVAPVPGGGLTAVKATIGTPFGKASCAWTHENGVFSMTVIVPVGTTCEAVLPDGTAKTLESGTYTLQCEY